MAEIATATLVAPADRSRPPGRVRHMFKKLDANNDGFLSLDELLIGFEREFEKIGGGLAPHAKDAISELFEEHAKTDDTHGKVLKIGQFARFYAVILFKHFDADNSGKLDLEEATAALKFLSKPSSDSSQLQVAFPPQAYDEAGGVKPLPFAWFWSTFRAMD